MARKFDFARDIQPHLEPIFRAAYRLTGNQPDAEELVQETCMRAIRHWQEREPDQPLLAWLMRVQYNLFVDQRRQKQRKSTLSLDELDSDLLIEDMAKGPEQRVDQQQGITAIDRAMSRLNPEQRALLVLRVEGYTLAEMREISGIEIQALSARLHRARQSLARLLRGECDVLPMKRRSGGEQ